MGREGGGVVWAVIIVVCCSSSLAGPVFERRGGELLGQQLTQQLEEAYSSAGTLDRKALAVIPGEQCWVLFVDVLVKNLSL